METRLLEIESGLRWYVVRAKLRKETVVEKRVTDLGLEVFLPWLRSRRRERSIDEMQAIAPLSPQQASEWLATMQRAFPDVKAGDELLGVHVPGSGARFYFNGQLRATVDDPAFSARFFGIWLSPGTSAPQLRTALIGASAR